MTPCAHVLLGLQLGLLDAAAKSYTVGECSFVDEVYGFILVLEHCFEKTWTF